MLKQNAFYGFTCDSRQNYFSTLQDINKKSGITNQIIFGIFYPEGGCGAEMGMRWHLLDNEEVPRLEVFSDAFKMLKQDKFHQIINDLDETLTPETFSKLLIKHGFKDVSDNPL